MKQPEYHLQAQVLHGESAQYNGNEFFSQAAKEIKHVIPLNPCKKKIIHLNAVHQKKSLKHTKFLRILC